MPNAQPKGYIEVFSERGTREFSTFMCCHCNRVCIVRPGSGVERGYCFNCDAIHCGGESCWADCRPFEAWLDWKEQTTLLRRYPGLPILGEVRNG